MSSVSPESKDPSQHSLPSYQLTRLELPPYSQVISKSNLDQDPKLLQDQPIHLNMQPLQYIDVDVAPQRVRTLHCVFMHFGSFQVRLKVVQPLYIAPNSYLKLTIFLFVLLSIIAPHTLPCTTIALILSYKVSINSDTFIMNSFHRATVQAKWGDLSEANITDGQLCSLMSCQFLLVLWL